MLLQISGVVHKWMKKLQDSLDNDSIAQELVSKLLFNPSEALANYTYDSGLLRYKARVYVGSNKNYQTKVLIEVHSSHTCEHGVI